jgi:hypothetical protein
VSGRVYTFWKYFLMILWISMLAAIIFPFHM